MSYNFQNKNFQISRYPKSNLTSLKAWNASDEYILDYITENELIKSKTIIYHDRFGFLTTYLAEQEPKSVILFQSQEKSIKMNLEQNEIDISKVSFNYPLASLEGEMGLALIKVPKSADLFELYLQQLSENLSKDAIVIAGFMTKFFSKQILEIAQKYFEVVEQSLAKKKARLLILKKPLKKEKNSLIKEIPFKDDISFKQYYGVFSAKNVDYASQFFMEHMSVLNDDLKILDLGSGSGVLAWKANQLKPDAHINLLDDNYLANESAKLNMPEGNFHYHFKDDLKHITNNSFDLVISNPPFHFEHETNIEVSISLFSQVYKILKPRGRFQLVANKHLNYRTHLSKIFKHVESIAENDKFVVYSCVKTKTRLEKNPEY